VNLDAVSEKSDRSSIQFLILAIFMLGMRIAGPFVGESPECSTPLQSLSRQEPACEIKTRKAKSKYKNTKPLGKHCTGNRFEVFLSSFPRATSATPPRAPSATPPR
jgi:hypothetical protein